MYDMHHRVNVTKAKLKNDAQAVKEPSYNVVRQLYKDAAVAEDEWIFIRAIADMHPGKYKASQGYFKDLGVFLKHWCDASKLEMPSNYFSKRALAQWVATHYYKKQRCKHVCTDVCAL